MAQFSLLLVLLVCIVVLCALSSPTFATSADAVSAVGEEEEISSNLLDAAARRDIDGIRNALEDGEHIDVTNVNGWTAASFAVAAGDIDTLEYLINEGIDLNIANAEGYTPLMLAALQVRVYFVCSGF
jgi:ankyrin repeat protein